MPNERSHLAQAEKESRDQGYRDSLTTLHPYSESQLSQVQMPVYTASEEKLSKNAKLKNVETLPKMKQRGLSHNQHIQSEYGKLKAQHDQSLAS